MDYASRIVSWTMILAIVYAVMRGNAGVYLGYLGI